MVCIQRVSLEKVFSDKYHTKLIPVSGVAGWFAVRIQHDGKWKKGELFFKVGLNPQHRD